MQTICKNEFVWICIYIYIYTCVCKYNSWFYWSLPSCWTRRLEKYLHTPKHFIRENMHSVGHKHGIYIPYLYCDRNWMVCITASLYLCGRDFETNSVRAFCKYQLQFPLVARIFHLVNGHGHVQIIFGHIQFIFCIIYKADSRLVPSR